MVEQSECLVKPVTPTFHSIIVILEQWRELHGGLYKFIGLGHSLSFFRHGFHGDNFILFLGFGKLFGTFKITCLFCLCVRRCRFTTTVGFFNYWGFFGNTEYDAYTTANIRGPIHFYVLILKNLNTAIIIWHFSIGKYCRFRFKLSSM